MCLDICTHPLNHHHNQGNKHTLSQKVSFCPFIFIAGGSRVETLSLCVGIESWASLAAQMIKNSSAMQRQGSIPGWEDLQDSRHD